MNTYRVTLALIVEEDGQRYEESMHPYFTAEGDAQAVRDAIRFARNRSETFMQEISCVKVSRETFGPIDEGGYLTLGSSGAFFEWKCDYPDTLEECATRRGF